MKSKAGKPLDDYEMVPGYWKFSIHYLSVAAAERWGIEPSRFRQLSELDQAEMMAKIRVDAKRMAADEFRRQQETELRTARNSGGKRLKRGRRR